MPCSFCRKPKLKFIMGKRYKLDDTEYICAQVDREKFALINLINGNRYRQPGALHLVASAKDGFKEIN